MKTQTQDILKWLALAGVAYYIYTLVRDSGDVGASLGPGSGMAPANIAQNQPIRGHPLASAPLQVPAPAPAL